MLYVQFYTKSAGRTGKGVLGEHKKESSESWLCGWLQDKQQCEKDPTTSNNIQVSLLCESIGEPHSFQRQKRHPRNVSHSQTVILISGSQANTLLLSCLPWRVGRGMLQERSCPGSGNWLSGGRNSDSQHLLISILLPLSQKNPPTHRVLMISSWKYTQMHPLLLTWPLP